MTPTNDMEKCCELCRPKMLSTFVCQNPFCDCHQTPLTIKLREEMRHSSPAMEKCCEPDSYKECCRHSTELLGGASAVCGRRLPCPIHRPAMEPLIGNTFGAVYSEPAVSPIPAMEEVRTRDIMKMRAENAQRAELEKQKVDKILHDMATPATTKKSLKDMTLGEHALMPLTEETPWTPAPSDWRKNFEEKFGYREKLEHFQVVEAPAEEIKDFIENLLSSQREEIARKVEGYLEESEMQPHFPGGATNFVKKGRKEAIDFFLSLLKDNK